MEGTIFKSGNSIVARLPKGCRLPIGKIDVNKIGDTLIIRSLEPVEPVERKDEIDALFEKLEEFTKHDSDFWDAFEVEDEEPRPIPEL